MNKAELKELVISQVEKDREKIIGLGTEIYNNPETGYKEVKTTETIFKALEELNLKVDKNIAVTGCRAYGNEDKTGPKLAILGELDSVVCEEHKDSDKDTGAMHACGHNIQVAVMYGVASALVKSGALKYLDGKIDFMAVPAEEYLQLSYRQRLKDEGKIKYFGGKPELIRKGAFDDVDISMMVHNFPIGKDGYKCAKKNTGNGFIGKRTMFIGREAHAGAAPWDGVNALNMASLALSAINAQRETFKEEDYVRIHQVMNKGGDIVNTVPADVQLETMVRSRNISGLSDASEKFNRSIRGAAIALGGKAIVYDSVGYMPLNASDELADLFGENAEYFYSKEEILPCMESTASFDIGDLSLLMPVLHGITTGVEGGLHTKDYKIVDNDDAYITPVKIMCMTVIDLLFDGAKKAQEIKENYKDKLTKEEYIQMVESLVGTHEYE